MSVETERVSAVLNAAADEVLKAIDAADTGVRDAVNLVVNATLTRLDQPEADDAFTLGEVVARCYDADLPQILEWCRS